MFLLIRPDDGKFLFDVTESIITAVERRETDVRHLNISFDSQKKQINHKLINKIK